jgi:hypothetical protein
VIIGISLQCEKPHEAPKASSKNLGNNVSAIPEEAPEKGVLRHQEWDEIRINKFIQPGQLRASVLKIAGEPFSSFSFNGITRDQYHFDNKFSEDDQPGGHGSGFFPVKLLERIGAG